MNVSRSPVEHPGRQWVRPALVVLLVVLLVVAVDVIGGTWGARYIPRFTAMVHGLGVWAPVVFIGGYIVACVAAFPGSLLTLAAGAIFGLAAGVAYVFVGAVLGSAAAFLIARYVVRGVVQKRVAHSEKIQAIDSAVANEGRKIVFLLRLSPLIPFALLNYVLGLTKVSFRDYLLASVGMLPGTVLYVYYGKVAGDVAAVAGGFAPSRGAGYYAFLAAGLLATIAATVLITRTARRALKKSAL